jgi:2'-phosphotransferase
MMPAANADEGICAQLCSALRVMPASDAEDFEVPLPALEQGRMHIQYTGCQYFEGCSIPVSKIACGCQVFQPMPSCNAALCYDNVLRHLGHGECGNAGRRDASAVYVCAHVLPAMHVCPQCFFTDAARPSRKWHGSRGATHEQPDTISSRCEVISHADDFCADGYVCVSPQLRVMFVSQVMCACNARATGHDRSFITNNTSKPQWITYLEACMCSSIPALRFSCLRGMMKRDKSKRLSYVLRHGAVDHGIAVDAEGWVSVEDVTRLTRASLGEMRRIASACPKQRFEIRGDGRFIRCVQGHTMPEVQISLPPFTHGLIVHGTTRQAWQTIRVEGLRAMNRSHIHFAQHADQVRKGSSVLIWVDAEASTAKGVSFGVASNGIVLTKDVLHPSHFVKVDQVGQRRRSDDADGHARAPPRKKAALTSSSSSTMPPPMAKPATKAIPASIAAAIATTSAKALPSPPWSHNRERRPDKADMNVKAQALPPPVPRRELRPDKADMNIHAKALPPPPPLPSPAVHTGSMLIVERRRLANIAKAGQSREAREALADRQRKHARRTQERRARQASRQDCITRTALTMPTSVMSFQQFQPCNDVRRKKLSRGPRRTGATDGVQPAAIDARDVDIKLYLVLGEKAKRSNMCFVAINSSRGDVDSSCHISLCFSSLMPCSSLSNNCKLSFKSVLARGTDASLEGCRSKANNVTSHLAQLSALSIAMQRVHSSDNTILKGRRFEYFDATCARVYNYLCHCIPVLRTVPQHIDDGLPDLPAAEGFKMHGMPMQEHGFHVWCSSADVPSCHPMLRMMACGSFGQQRRLHMHLLDVGRPVVGRRMITLDVDMHMQCRRTGIRFLALERIFQHASTAYLFRTKAWRSTGRLSGDQPMQGLASRAFRLLAAVCPLCYACLCTWGGGNPATHVPPALSEPPGPSGLTCAVLVREPDSVLRQCACLAPMHVFHDCDKVDPAYVYAEPSADARIPLHEVTGSLDCIDIDDVCFSHVFPDFESPLASRSVQFADHATVLAYDEDLPAGSVSMGHCHQASTHQESDPFLGPFRRPVQGRNCHVDPALGSDAHHGVFPHGDAGLTQSLKPEGWPAQQWAEHCARVGRCSLALDVDSFRPDPRCPYAGAAMEMPLPEGLPATVQLLEAWPHQAMPLEFPAYDMHESTAEAVPLLVSGRTSDIVRLNVYLDGSFFEHGLPKTMRTDEVDKVQEETAPRSGWAIAVIADLAASAQGQAGQACIGHAYSCIDLENQESSLGAEFHSAANAEGVAQIMGHLWVIQWQHAHKHLLRPDVAVSFHFDCMTVGKAAGGHQRWSAGGRLAMHVRSTGQIVTQLFAKCTLWRHVKAHDGQAWNEACDGMAKYAAVHKLRSDSCPRGPPLHGISDQALCWAWLVHAPEAVRSAFPILCSNAAMQWRRVAVEPHNVHLPSRIPVSVPQAATPEHRAVCLSLRVVSANALTLNVRGTSRTDKQYQAGLTVQGKAEILEVQLHKLGVHVCGIQETRAKKACTFSGLHYYMIQSAATQRGQSGVALWINVELPFTTDSQGPHEQRFHPSQAVVLHDSERCLLVRVQHDRFAVDYLVAHSPDEGWGGEEQRAWWGDMRKLISTRKQALETPVVLMIDSNSRLGSVQSEMIGGFDAAEECPNGSLFREFLGQQRLALPSTGPGGHHVHEGASPTWTSTANTSHRTDYVGVPVEWLTGVHHSSVLASDRFDMLNAREDHSPVMIDIRLKVPDANGAKPSRIKPICVNRSLMKDDSCVAAFLDDIQRCSSINWNVEVNLHCHEVDSCIRKAVAKHFPADQPQPRQPFIQEATWELVAARKKAQAALRPLNFCITKLGHSVNAEGTCSADREAYLAEVNILNGKRDVLVQAIRDVHKPLHKLIQQDRNRHLNALAEAAGQAETQGQIAALYQAISPWRGTKAKKSRSKLKPLPALSRTDGTMCTSPQEVAERWQEFFSTIESGVPQTFESLIDAYVERVNNISSTVPDFHNVPSQVELEYIICSLTNGKAGGLDGIIAEILKLSPSVAARL